MKDKNSHKKEVIPFLKSLKEERKTFRISDNDILRAKVIILEKIGDKIVGIAGINRSFGMPLVFIVVASKYQGRSIGNILMEKINNIAKDNYSYLMLKVMKSNKIAIRLYQKNGYKFLCEAGDSYFMSLALKRQGQLIIHILKLILPLLYPPYLKLKNIITYKLPS